jgi:dienelactone hydrolase
MKKVIVLSALVIIGILFPTQIKRGFLSLLILIDSVQSPDKAMMGKLIDGPMKTTVKVRSKGRVIRADLYRCLRHGRQVPLLLVHGVNPAGKDDDQLVLLAKDLARAGFLVLVPDFEGMKTLRIRISDAEDVLQCFLYLSRDEHAGPRGGMLGISYGAGPMLLAAADPRIRDKVSVVTTFGAYYDLRTVLSIELTGTSVYGGLTGYMRSEDPLRWMVAYRNLDLLSSSDDRAKLKKIIELRNTYDIAAAKSLARSLGPEGRAIYAFLANTRQERFSPLYESLPLPVREYVYRISPSRAIRYITASFIVIHGIDDQFVPYTESVRLAEAVGDENRVYLALLPQFMQGEQVEPSLRDRYQRYVVAGWRLFKGIYVLLERSGIQ